MSTLKTASLLAAGMVFSLGAAFAAPQPSYPGNAAVLFEEAMPGRAAIDAQLPSDLQRQIAGYPTTVAAGTVVIDTANTHLYYVLGDGTAIRYSIGVGREGYTWSGAQTVSRKAEWPDWTPPQEMILRQPYLPRWMAGGESNPLGARAIYLGSTVYRIHGTNMPATIGQKVSSGCIRMLNADVIDLYARVHIGTKIVVLPNANTVAAIAR